LIEIREQNTYKRRYHNEKYLYAPLEDCDEFTLADVLSSDADCVENEVEKKVLAEQIYSKVEKLRDIEYDVIKMRYGSRNAADKITHREIALLLNVSTTWINKVEKRAIEKMKRQIL